ncbi:MAG: cyclic nucleotide-binding domain-containing protein [Acidobacteria bacterium]|nr:cyclic nucleotide-binding domain-containing protein [Acidobacteriota bacterium]
MYIGQHCWSCDEALRLAEEVKTRFGEMDIDVIDVDAEGSLNHDDVFSTPTYVFNGRTISLGNPSLEELLAKVSASMVDRAGVRIVLRTELTSMPGTLSKLTQRLMGNRTSAATAAETDYIDGSLLRDKIGYLSAMELFHDFTPDEMQEIDRATRMQTCATGRVFYMPREMGEVLFILKKGAVQIYRLSPEGRKLVIAKLPSDSFFGEMSCIGQGMYDTYAEATEESLICTMSRGDVERLLLSKPKVALRILEAVGRRVVDAERQLEENRL